MSSEIFNHEVLEYIDPTIEHFNNPKVNAFAEGIAANECSENCRILLRNVSSKLKRVALNGLLSQFGTVVDINIPQNQDNFNNKEGFMSVFAEFSKFGEAEKAVRELNDRKNEGLQIRAAFAYKKREDEQVQLINQRVNPENVAKEEETVYRLPLTVNFETDIDDIHERVTAFERKRVFTTYEDLKEREMSIKLAKQSKGSYDGENQCFIFNSELLDRMASNPVCSQCDKEALLRCESTSLFFCSIKCSVLSQSPTVENDSIEENEVKFGKAIQVNDKVVIMGIINEKCLYVRHAKHDDGRIMNDVFKFSKVAKKLETFPEIGELVLARYHDQVYRSRVIEISDEDDYAITVQLIDYGNTARVFLNDLMEMTQACQRIECATHKVLLKGVKIDAINENVVSFLSSLLDDKTELTVKMYEDSNVVLIDKATAVNINEKIVELAVVDVVSYANGAGATVDYNLDSFIPLECNQRLFVVNMDLFLETGSLICLAESDLKDFHELYRAINVYGKKHRALKGSSGLAKSLDEVCLAFCNNQWHRASVTEAFGDGRPECYFIDLCCRQRVSVQDIIAMPSVFKDPPPLAQLCEIEGCKDDSEKVRNYAASFIEGGKMMFVDEVLEGEEETTILRIRKVLKKAAELKDDENAVEEQSTSTRTC